MRLQTRIALAIGCVSLMALCLPAYGTPDSQGAKMFRAGESPKPAPRGKLKIATRDARADRLASTPVTTPLKRPASGWPILVSEARKYMGTNPTARTKLWCATFMNMVLRKAGYAGTNSDAARSFAYYGHRISSPKIGAIAVLARGKTGGHVGVVTGIDPHGNPIIISGNHGHRVGEGVYPSARVIAYVMPTESRPLTQAADRSSSARASNSTSSNSSSINSGNFEIDSPISELIAAIEAEQSHGDGAKPQQAQPQPAQQQQAQPQQQQQRPAQAETRVAEAPRAMETQPVRPAAEPQVPHRLVQQTPDQASAPVDPTVADMFGLKNRSTAPIPPGKVPLPKQAARQGRVVAAALTPH